MSRHILTWKWLKENRACESSEKPFKRMFGDYAPMSYDTARRWIKNTGEDGCQDVIAVALRKLGWKLRVSSNIPPYTLRVDVNGWPRGELTKELAEYLGGISYADRWTIRRELAELNSSRICKFFDDVGRYLYKDEEKVSKKKVDGHFELHETRYGFNWGHTQVERIASHKGHQIIGVRTPREYLEIRVTPTGLIREGG